MTRLVAHLIDASVDTAFFRAIATEHDHQRFRVMIGSLASEGSLQRSMHDLRTPTFALGADRRRQYFAAVPRLARILKNAGASVLHAHCFDPTLVGLLAARLARIPVVFTRHHSDHNVRLGKRWHTRIDGWCARHADRVIAVSQATKDVMTTVEGVPASRIVVVYNGMTPAPAPTAADVARTRAELRLGDAPVCVIAARLHEEKGHGVLFDALVKVLPRFPSLVVLVAGQGPHRAELESEARRRGVEGAVRFLGQRADVPVLMTLASAVLVPSLAESFGFSALEAMSLERPVVASATGGIPEVVEDGVSGVLFPSGDAGALATALVSVLEDLAWAERLGRAGRRRAELFTCATMLQGYERVYAGL